MPAGLHGAPRAGLMQINASLLTRVNAVESAMSQADHKPIRGEAMNTAASQKRGAAKDLGPLPGWTPDRYEDRPSAGSAQGRVARRHYFADLTPRARRHRAMAS
jgi:hypothetical protein